MNTNPADISLRLDAIRRRVQVGQETVRAGGQVDLGELGEEIQDVTQALRAAPLQIDHEAVARELEEIIRDLNRLQHDITTQHAAQGGTVDPEDEAGA